MFYFMYVSKSCQISVVYIIFRKPCDHCGLNFLLLILALFFCLEIQTTIATVPKPPVTEGILRMLTLELRYA